jgi:hypothetical protein
MCLWPGLVVDTRYTILSSSGSQKKTDVNSFIFFYCSYSKMTIFKLTISNFKAPSSLVATLLVPIEGPG